MVRTLLLLCFLLTISSNQIFSQCAAYTTNTACTQAAPTVIGSTISCTPPNNNGGRRNFLVTNMVAGSIYRISNCGSGYDTQLTIRDNATLTVQGYNDDNGPDCSGVSASIDFTPSVTGDYRIQLNRYNCSTTNQLNGDINVTLLSAPLACPGSSTTFTDSGGTSGNYSNNENLTWTFQPDGGPVSVTFTSFNIENGWDYLYIYDGPDTSAPLVGSYTGTTSPPSYTSTHASGTLTFVFISDSSLTYSGWQATICGLPAAPSNDDCSDAVNLVSNATCSPTSGTTENASASGVTTCTGNPDDDVWYLFTATQTDHDIDLTPNSTNMAFEVFSGSCGSLTSISCVDSFTGSTAETISLTGLTTGSTYYIRVYTTGTNYDTFEICVTNPCITPTINTSGSCPFVDISPDPVNLSSCSGPSSSVDLTATYMDLGDTSNYAVSAINFDATYYNNLAAAATTPVAISSDDYWSSVVYTIPFDFCFYGNSVSDYVIGANGIISFDSSLAGAPSGFSFNANLPSTAGDLFENAIYGVYHDIDPGVGGSITYGTTSIGGCNALVVFYDNIPMFYDNSRYYSGMMVLYENTNIIEVYIEEKVVDGGSPWNGGNAIVGLQNPGATQAVVAPCRNGLDPNWTATNEAWRFTPSGGSSIATLQWYEGSIAPGNQVGSPNQTTVSVSPTSSTDYFAEITYNLCNGSSMIVSNSVTVNVSGAKTWNGSVSTDWYTAANWTPIGIPNNADCVVIPDATSTPNDPLVIGTPPTPPPPGLAGNLTLEANAYLELLSGSSVMVTDWIDVDPSATFLLRDDSNLVQVTNTGSMSINSGSIYQQRNVHGLGNLDYVYWSSPVNGFNITSVSPGTSTNLIYEWIPSIGGNGVGGYGNWQNTTEVMQAGKGYIVRGISGTSPMSTSPINTIEFNGSPRNGQITFPISMGSYTGADYSGAGTTVATQWDDNWNLIGNPYPSAISASDFINYNTLGGTNSAITGTIYLWRHLNIPSNAAADPFYEDFVYNYNENDYISFNGTGSTPAGFNGSIASGQGFFVAMADGATSSNIVFNNDMRFDSSSIPYGNSQFYRSTQENTNISINERHRIWLDLINQNNQAIPILIGYLPNASNDMDYLFDGVDISTENTRFYSIVEESKLTIQGKNWPFSNNEEVPLGVKIGSPGTYRIAISQTDGVFSSPDQHIFLEDRYEGVIHNLKSSTYVFNCLVGEFNDRFILRYSEHSLEAIDFELYSDVTISAPNSDYILINSKFQDIREIIVYDMVGRSIFQKNTGISRTTELKNTFLSSGVYMVHVTLDNNIIIQRKVVLKH